MKYVVIAVTQPNGDVREMPVIFPNALIHSIMASAAIAAMKAFQWQDASYKVISAGELSSIDVGAGSCHGSSETLKLKSRGEVDDTLISMHDYMHGIV